MCVFPVEGWSPEHREHIRWRPDPSGGSDEGSAEDQSQVVCKI